MSTRSTSRSAMASPPGCCQANAMRSANEAWSVPNSQFKQEICRSGRNSGEAMNREHLEGLRSDAWASFLETARLLRVRDGSVDLGKDTVEVGPGPGRTTDLLHLRFDRVTAVEIDEDLASELAARLKGSNVTVQQSDGA